MPHRQDSDAPGKQYRALRVRRAWAHIDSRDNVRHEPDPCAKELSTFPGQAYMSVGLYHLFPLVDLGTLPAAAERVWNDRDEATARRWLSTSTAIRWAGFVTSTSTCRSRSYAALNTPATPLIPNPSEWIVKNGGEQGAQTMCRLSAYQVPFTE